MPACAFEADEAIEEGVKTKWLTRVEEIIGPSRTVEGMTLDKHGIRGKRSNAMLPFDRSQS
jgi:hypothetical protein